MHQPEDSPRIQHNALVAGIAAFVAWGLAPAYWKLLKTVPSLEILAHRFIWTVLFLGMLLSWQGRWPEVLRNLRSRRASLFCLSSGVIMGVTWGLFIWAVIVGRVLETSLGYFMTPILNVLLGALVLRERLSPWQLASILIASAGVLFLTFGYGRFPWVAVALCLTFGVYGLLRKQSGTRAVSGVFIESIFLFPIALGYLFWLAQRGKIAFGPVHPSLSLLLVATGVVTAMPLVWFGYAARNLRLVTIGFLQYLAPTGSFFLGVFAYREPFTREHLITFLLIWIALVIVSAEAVLRWRRNGRTPSAVLPEPARIEPSI
jgi:chloramphenicol-sensitive protein RarD